MIDDSTEAEETVGEDERPISINWQISRLPPPRPVNLQMSSKLPAFGL
jgi:hypothetical protein